MAHLKPMPHSPSSSLFVCPADKPSMRAGDSTHKSSHLTRQAYRHISGQFIQSLPEC